MNLTPIPEQLVFGPDWLDAGWRSRPRWLGYGWTEANDAEQIVGGQCEVRPALVPGDASIAQFPSTADRLGPAKDLFDPLANALTDAVAHVPNRPAVDGAPSAAGVLGDMGRHSSLFASGDELPRVVALVRAQSHPMARCRPAVQHRQRCIALGRPARLGQQDIEHQPVPVLHQHVTGEAELRLLA